MRRSEDNPAKRELVASIRARHPGLRDALRADTKVVAAHRGERSEFRSGADLALNFLRLLWVTDAFAAQALYRVKASLQARGVPVLPRIAHRLAMLISQVAIGDYTVIAPGIYIVHGQCVIDGITEVGSGVVVSPQVTVGLRAGDFQGPVIESNVNIGAGAKVIGPIRVADGAKIGANAVVVHDVPPGATVVGSPARPVEVELAADGRAD